jgi:hypothetical protein
MGVKHAATLAVATLAFLTAFGLLSPLLLLFVAFVGASFIWAAVRMPPFWRFTRHMPPQSSLAGVYALHSPVPGREQYSFELKPDGSFSCTRFPIFTSWPPLEVETAFAGSGVWQLERTGRFECTVVLTLMDAIQVDISGTSEGHAPGYTLSRLRTSLRIAGRHAPYSLLNWVGGFLGGRVVRFEQQPGAAI